MIEYIVPTNIDDRVVSRAASLLENGGVLALPTDTSWSLVCSPKSPDGIKKLRRHSGERDERHFTLLCSGISQFGDWCSLDNTRFRLIKRLSPGPYVFILKTLPGTEKILDIRRREAGIRIPDYPVPIRIIETLEHPLYSITAKKSMTGMTVTESYNTADIDTEPHLPDALPPIPEEELFESGWELEDISGVDMVLDDGEERARVFSTILDLSGEEIILLRKGLGSWPA